MDSNITDRVDSLLVGFAKIWELPKKQGGFGQVATDNHKAFWKDSFRLLEKVRVSSGHTEVVSAIMSSGKSATLKYYAQNVDTKILIVVELTKTCDKFVEDLGEDIAGTAHSKSDNTLADIEDKQVVIITHSKLGILMKSEVANEFFEGFDIVAIDESITTYQHIDLTVYDLEFIQSMGSLIGKEYKFLDFHLDRLKALPANTTIPFRKSLDFNNHIMDWSNLVEELTPLLDTRVREKYKLTNILDKLSALSRKGRVKVVSYEADSINKTLNVVLDFFPDNVSKIIYDGTANTNETYQLIQEHVGNLTLHTYSNIRNSNNIKLMFYKGSIGKSSLTTNTKTKAVEVKEKMANYVKWISSRYNKEDKVLFILHKANVFLGTKTTDKTRGYFYRLIQEASEGAQFSTIDIDTKEETKMPNWNVIWWGGETVGSNLYQDYSKVVMYGLNLWSDIAYRAHYNATLSATSVLDYNPIESLKGSLLAVDILQAMYRGSSRQSIDREGNCPIGTEIIIPLPNNKSDLANTVRKHIVTAVNTPNVEDITYTTKPKSNSTLANKINKLLAHLHKLQELGIKYVVPKYINYNDGEASLLDTSSYIKGNREKEPVEIDRVFSRAMYKSLMNKKNKPNVLERLMSEGWGIVPMTQEARVATETSNNVKDMFVFTQLDTFKDETVTIIPKGKDINGNDF